MSYVTAFSWVLIQQIQKRKKKERTRKRKMKRKEENTNLYIEQAHEGRKKEGRAREYNKHNKMLLE